MCFFRPVFVDQDKMESQYVIYRHQNYHNVYIEQPAMFAVNNKINVLVML